MPWLINKMRNKLCEKGAIRIKDMQYHEYCHSIVVDLLGLQYDMKVDVK